MNDHIPDPTKMINETPISDSTAHNVGDLGMLCRRLERELNAANDRIKRLEEAGDALFENSNPSRWDSTEAAARKIIDQSNWNKAKEAKP
jgi:hypothetical protein